MKQEKRPLDRRYKPNVDSGYMSRLNIPLPLRGYSVIKVNPEDDILSKKQKLIQSKMNKGKSKKKYEKERANRKGKN